MAATMDLSMYATLRAAAETLRATGITDGVIPSEEVRHGNVAFVRHPGDAVERWYDDKTLVGGVSVIGHNTGSWEAGVPVDILLGWVDPETHAFRWAFRNEEALPVPLTLANVFEVLTDVVTHVPLSALPVWLTIGDLAFRDRVVSSCGAWPRMTDVMDDIVAAERRAAFWSVAYEEFIRRTWHPSRVMDWCLDEDDRAELFPA